MGSRGPAWGLPQAELESSTMRPTQKMNLNMSPAPAVVGNEKKGRAPGSFPQTPGPQEEVKVRGSTVLANGFTTVILSPGKGRSHIHDETCITRSGDASKKF